MSIFQNGGGGCFHCNLGHFVYCLFGKVKESKPGKLPFKVLIDVPNYFNFA